MPRERSIFFSRRLSVFLKIALNEGGQGIQSLLCVSSFGGQGEDRAMTGGKHHEAHNTFAINFFAVLLHADFGRKLARGLHELSGGPRVNPEFIRDGQFRARHRSLRRTLGGW